MKLTKRQNDIIDAAIELIAQKGIQELTIKNLAGSLGISEPALYRHFSSKSEIIRTLILRFDEAFPIFACQSRGFAAIREFVTARMNQLIEKPALSKVLFSEEFFIRDPEFSEMMMQMMHRHKDWVTARLAEGIENREIRSDIALNMLFRLLLGPIRLLFKQWGMCGMKFDLRQEGNQLLDAMEQMLRQNTK